MRDDSGVTVVGGQGGLNGQDRPHRPHRLRGRPRRRRRARGARACARRGRSGRRARRRRRGGARGARPAAPGHPMRVLVREKIADAGVELLRRRFDVDVDLDGDLAETIGATTRSSSARATKLTDELLARAPRLKVIGRAGVGIDNVDLAAASKRGIVVANAPESTVVSAGRARARPPVRPRPLDPAGARRAEGGALGALALPGDRAGGQDARRRRLRPHRPARRAARARPRDARRRPRPVRRARALPRARRSSGPTASTSCSPSRTSSRCT